MGFTAFCLGTEPVSFFQEEFRLERGPQLLALVEDAFSSYENGLHSQWSISLSKPNENDKHLLMTLAGEHGKLLCKGREGL